MQAVVSTFNYVWYGFFYPLNQTMNHRKIPRNVRFHCTFVCRLCNFDRDLLLYIRNLVNFLGHAKYNMV